MKKYTRTIANTGVVCAGMYVSFTAYVSHVYASVAPTSFSFADGTLSDLMYAIIGLFNPVIVLLAGIAVIVFMWGVIKYINATGDPKRLKEGSKYLVFGILAFVVIVGLWGIVKTVTGLLGLEYAGPQFKTSKSGGAAYSAIETDVQNP